MTETLKKKSNNKKMGKNIRYVWYVRSKLPKLMIGSNNTDSVLGNLKDTVFDKDIHKLLLQPVITRTEAKNQDW